MISKETRFTSGSKLVACKYSLGFFVVYCNNAKLLFFSKFDVVRRVVKRYNEPRSGKLKKGGSMSGKISRICFIFVLGFCLFQTCSWAQISGKKAELISQVLDITAADKVSDGLRNTIFSQMKKDYPNIVSTFVERQKELEPTQKAQLYQYLIEDEESFLEMFKSMYAKRSNITRSMRDIYFDLYDKYFSEQELKDLVVFYSSETGQKSLKVMPQLFQESMNRSKEVLNPYIIELVDQIMQEEANRWLANNRDGQ